MDGSVPTPRSWRSSTATGSSISILTAAVRLWIGLAVMMVGAWANAAEAGNPYLRLGLGFDQSKEATFMDSNCRGAHTYGCPYHALGDFGTSAVLEFGLGHDTGSTMRYELLFEYRPRFNFEGEANYFSDPTKEESVRAKLSSLSAMVAAFADLDRSANSPFIGFGIGMARNKVGTKTMTFPGTMTILPGNTSSDLAWMVTAGFGVVLDERATLDVAWRYTDLGKVRTGAGIGRNVRRSTGVTRATWTTGPTQARLAGHGLRISMRRSF